MRELSGFLKKFSYLLHNKNVITEVVQEICGEVAGVYLEKGEIKIKNSTLTVNTSAPQKTQLFISKEKILKEIEYRVGKRAITEIR